MTEPDPTTSGSTANTRQAPTGMLRRYGGYAMVSLLAIGVIAGIVFWGGFHTVIEWTNTETFCISCHEMRENVYAEYRKTIHYNNRTGVRAVCADCHVPREWGPKMLRKIRATAELWGKLMGTIDTREKFVANRLRLAENEWKRMKANDSLECRNCHGLAYMDTEKQKQRARRQHELAQKDGQTCIDCHKGIAHTKPQGMKEED